MAEHGSDPATRFARGRWPRCVCGYDPRDNKKLAAHFAEHGFREVDDHGKIIRYPVGELEPMKWTPERSADDATGPLHYTAPGGWLIVNDPDVHAPDRPWVLYRHGVRVARGHTLRICKREALLHTESNEAAR